MKDKAFPVSVVLAVLIGLVQTYFLVYAWSYIAAYSTLPRWLIDIGLKDSFRVTLHAIDFLTSVVLSLPAAFAITKLRPRKLWLYLGLAVVPGFIWQNIGVLGNPVFAEFPGEFVLGWLPALLSLPCATWLVCRVAPNNSFKPKPLRGSA